MTQSSTGRPTSQPASAKTVLIIDDTPENLAVLGELLQPFYRVRAANSGARAIAVANSIPRPDIILLDVMMPEVDGFEVLRRLRAEEATRAIPVIFVTALGDSADEEHGLSLGAVDYITKPITPATVLARVRTHLELKDARDHLAHENEWLEREVARRTQETLFTQDLTIRALACLAEARDNETGQHIVRTQAYVQILAEALVDTDGFRESLAGPALEMVVKAAPLHDIGKVGIPDAILLKPGKLTPEEFAIMKTHAQIGVDAIRKAMDQTLIGTDEIAGGPSVGTFEFLRIAQEIAGGHHEKWDGSGYPAGLVGDRIPVSARLMALADVFDALTTRRVYKAAMSVEVATQIIREGRGTHFDPAVVDTFLARIERFAEIAARHPDGD